MSTKMIKDGVEYPIGVIPQNVIDDVTFLKNASKYSTTEHKVGKWIDGSDLYEKTVDFGALPNNTTKTVAHNITNLSKIVEIRGTAFNSSNGAIPLPLIVSSTDVSDLAINVSLNLTLTDVVIKCMTNRSAYNGYITIRYTKTS